MNQTGPRTAAGKARSASNSLKHGFTAQRLAVPDHLREEFDEIQAAFHEETNPQGALETLAAHRAFHAAWNLRRLEELESEILATSDNPLGDEPTARQLDRLSRYHTRHERAYSRAMNELRRLQTDRALRATLPREEGEEPLPVLAAVSEVISAKRNPPANPTDAFAPLFQEMDRDIAAMREQQKLLDRLVKEAL